MAVEVLWLAASIATAWNTVQGEQGANWYKSIGRVSKYPCLVPVPKSLQRMYDFKNILMWQVVNIGPND